MVQQNAAVRRLNEQVVTNQLLVVQQFPSIGLVLAQVLVLVVRILRFTGRLAVFQKGAGNEVRKGLSVGEDVGHYPMAR